MITRYIPIYEITQLLRKKSKEMRRYRCYSSWFYNTEENSITICTNQPGYWIGRMGQDVARLKEEINAIIDKHNPYNDKKMEHITIKFIETEC